jgi:predicted dehydrogenase
MGATGEDLQMSGNNRYGVTRRTFLMGALASATLPSVFSTRQGMAGTGPNDRINLGCIGVGRQGRADMQEAINRGLDANARVVAVCDLDINRANDAKKLAIQNYEKAKEAAPDISVYQDFRELLARKDIDGVVIVTPDHWHTVASIHAAKAGKDIYQEKPMTNTIAEGQALIKAIRDNKRVFQLGSQQRSSVYFRKACELVRNGKVGKLHTITVRLPEDTGYGNPAVVPVPENLKYEMWLGPTPDAPYSVDRVHPMDGYSRPGWLQIEPYCHGMITGWGAHMLDIAQWGNGTEDSGLTEIEAHGEFPDRGLFNVHTKYHATGKFSNGTKLIQESGDHVTKFEGDEGWISVSRSKLDASNRDLLKAKIPDDGVHLYESKNHMMNFLECMRSRKEPAAPVEVGHRSNSVCLVTHIAMKLNRKLQFDPKTERFIDDEEANKMLSYKHRAPWTI